MKEAPASEPSFDIDAWSKKFRKLEEALEEKLNRSEYVPARHSDPIVSAKEPTNGSYADKKLTKKTFEMILRKLRSLEE